MKRLERAKRFFRNFVFVVQVVYKGSPYRTITILASELLSIPLRVLGVWYSKAFIDIVVKAIKESNFDNIRLAVSYIAITIGTEIAGKLLYEISRTNQSILGQIANKHVTRMIVEKASRLNLGFFDSKPLLDKLDNARNAINFQWVNLLQQTINMIGAIISIITWCGILSLFKWWIAPLVILGWLPGIIFERRLRLISASWRTGATPELKKMNYIESVLSNSRYAKEVRLYGMASNLLTRYDSLSQSYFKRYTRLLNTSQKYALVTEIGSYLTSAATSVLFALSAFKGVITLGDFTLYTRAVSAIGGELGGLIRDAGFAMERDYMADTVLDFLNEPEAYSQGEDELPTGPHRIELCNVSFQYPGNSSFTLHEINLTIEPGQQIGIVGRNGAGKSTLTKIIAGLYKPTHGLILIDGIPSTSFTDLSIYRSFAAVFQDYATLGFTIEENITLNETNYTDRERLYWSATQADVIPRISSLPLGFDTYLTKEYNNEGLELSGGESQKLAIARGYYRNADIYLLDEPTAHLDPEAEAQTFNHFSKMTKDSTTILVSHRLAGVVDCDRILVMDNGKIVETGTHQELTKLDGVYNCLFTAQAQRYLHSDKPA